VQSNPLKKRSIPPHVTCPPSRFSGLQSGFPLLSALSARVVGGPFPTRSGLKLFMVSVFPFPAAFFFDQPASAPTPLPSFFLRRRFPPSACVGPPCTSVRSRRNVPRQPVDLTPPPLTSLSRYEPLVLRVLSWIDFFMERPLPPRVGRKEPSRQKRLRLPRQVEPSLFFPKPPLTEVYISASNVFFPIL